MKIRSGWLRAGIAVLVGCGIAAVDNFASGGEVSPIVIVAMLFISCAIAGVVWGARAKLAALIIWVWLPMAHVLKHALGLPDTIHPNTYSSILKLGLFSLLVAAIGLGFGLAFRRLVGKRIPTRV